jgi:hypothetical protein
MTLTTLEVLVAMSESDTLAYEVLNSLNVGMFDEWDCELLTDFMKNGFGGPELRLAAASGVLYQRIVDEHKAATS